MECMIFPPKTIIICSGEKEGFDYKNNYECDKLANSWLNNINKINCKTLIVLSYILLGLGSKKI